MVLCGALSVCLGLGMLLFCRHRQWKSIRSPCLVLFAFGLFGLLLGIMEGAAVNGAASGRLKRRAPGEGELNTEAYVYLPQQDTEYAVELSIPERKYRREEELALLAAAIEEIQETFCRENVSLEEIVHSPDVREHYQDGAVAAEWSFSERRLISAEGVLDEKAVKQKVKKRQEVKASVLLSCGESEKEYAFLFWIVPGKKSRREELLLEIEEQIAGQEETQETVTLPEQIGGRELVWRERPAVRPEELLGLGVLVAAAVFYAGREQKEREDEKRKRSLLLSYPEFVGKLSLMLGAGMGISGALRKMDQLYLQRQKEGAEKEEAYEALHRMICEMENGMGELRAYQAFSEDCGLQPYRKLTALLTAGQRVGSQRLLEQLNEEADRVFLERKNAARRLGEEAGTKLLAPMMMMLLIVMGIVMIPAFLSIYGI